MLVEVQEQTTSEPHGENMIILRIGVPQNSPVRWSELTEISLPLNLDQAHELADVLQRFAVENKFPEESVRFEFKGDNSSKAFATACVKRPHSSSQRLPVTAQFTRRDRTPSE